MSAVVIFDIDGTLANCDHRLKDLNEKDYDAFNMMLVKDTPYQDAMLMLKLLKNAGATIVLCTARHRKWRTKTVWWLNTWGIEYDALLMRNDDCQSDADCKKELVFNWLKLTDRLLLDIAMIFEDKESVVKMWRDSGFTCYQVREGRT